MKRFNLKNILFFCTLFAVVGCAIGGKNFKFRHIKSLEIGKTTRTEAINLIGKTKYIQKSTLDSAKTGESKTDTFKTLSYNYRVLSTIGGSVTRGLILSFKNDTLHGTFHYSSFPKDDTDFKIDAARNIKFAKSSKQDVLQLLGEPSSKTFCPSAMLYAMGKCEDSAEVWAWTYIEIARFNSIYFKTKSLIVSFDKKGVVTSISTYYYNN